MKLRYKLLIVIALATFTWYWLSGALYVWGI